MSTEQKLREAQRLAREFNCYFNSGNAIEVPARVSVPRDQWRALFAAIEALSLPATEQASAEPLKPMIFDDGRKGWFVDHPEFYIDIEPDETGKWSCFFRHKPSGKEAFAEQQAGAEQEPVFLLHTGALFGGERDEWDVEANSGRAVDELCDRYPGQTIGLYAAPVSQPAPAASDKTVAIGAQLANVAFNWANRVGHTLTGDDVALLDSLRKKWDAALSDRKPAPSPLPGLSGLLEQVLDVLEESRDDVLSELQRAKELAGYPSTDRRLKAVQAQLQRHDSILAVVRAAIAAKKGQPT